MTLWIERYHLTLVISRDDDGQARQDRISDLVCGPMSAQSAMRSETPNPKASIKSCGGQEIHGLVETFEHRTPSGVWVSLTAVTWYTR